jgi:hypothetical protein
VKVSIVIPTMPGREDELERTIATYESRTSISIEWVIEHHHATCAAGWNAGAARATGEVVHMGADDLEPTSDQWLPAALHAIEAGCIPLGWVSEDEIGRFGRDFARVPACHRDWWHAVPAELHYYSDNWFGDQMRRDGHHAIVVDGFDFYHRRSMVGRNEAERVSRDYAAYQRLSECSTR